MRPAQLGHLAQRRSEGVQTGIARLEAADRLALLQSSTQALVQVRGLAVGPTVCLTAHVAQDPVILETHHGAVGPHQPQQPRDRLRGLQVVDGPMTSCGWLEGNARAGRGRGQQPAAALGHRQLEVIGVSRVAQQTASQKGPAQDGASAADVL